jgi:intracellular sulfur oxidation DsrE/DsrF family protein
MKSYIIVETRDPFEQRDTEWLAALAAGLKRDGARPVVMLAENGVFAARAAAASASLQTLTQAGVEVFADRFALRERGIRDGELASGVKAADLDLVVDQLEAGAIAMFR